MFVKDANTAQEERKNAKDNVSLERRRQHAATASITVPTLPESNLGYKI